MAEKPERRTDMARTGRERTVIPDGERERPGASGNVPVNPEACVAGGHRSGPVPCHFRTLD